MSAILNQVLWNGDQKYENEFCNTEDEDDCEVECIEDDCDDKMDDNESEDEYVWITWFLRHRRRWREFRLYQRKPAANNIVGTLYDPV